jgi:uncharacterized protein YndB with AHSA1/START domain
MLSRMDEGERATSEILVPAPADETWEAITDPERLGEWLGDEVELDLRPGGEFEIEVDEERRTGFVEEVEPERRLVFWWRRDADEDSSRVEIELEPGEAGTRVRVVESRPLEVLGAPGIEIETGFEAGGSAPQMSSGPLALVG